jgi:hypothetical protein
MSTYHVTFYKKLLSSDGHPFNCVQGDLSVDGQHPRQAAESACRQFETARGVRNWSELADYFDLEVADRPIGYPFAADRRTGSKAVAKKADADRVGQKPSRA